MNDKLQKAKDELLAETADTRGKLNSIRTFIRGVPALVAAAVETALANANVDEETAATEIDAARQSLSDDVDATLAAIDETPAPEEAELPPVAEETPPTGAAPAAEGPAPGTGSPTPDEG